MDRLSCASTIALLAFPVTLSAHHLMSGKLPGGALDGLLSGLSHPVIGLDHFFVVLAAGMLSARLRRGVWIPVAFAIASILGTGLHLMSIDLVGVQVVVAGSLVCFGLGLAFRPHGRFKALLAVAFASGIFHGFAYAESIVGAEPAPLVAYLAGFTVIQLAVAAIGRALVNAAPRWTLSGGLWQRRFGTVMSLSGIVLLARALM